MFCFQFKQPYFGRVLIKLSCIAEECQQMIVLVVSLAYFRFNKLEYLRGSVNCAFLSFSSYLEQDVSQTDVFPARRNDRFNVLFC